MASSALVDLFRCEKLTTPQSAKIKFKLISFGDWARKLIDKDEEEKQGAFSLIFCIQLEYRLATVFSFMDREDVKGFWCDGISPCLVSKKELNDKRKIITCAWLGECGQIVYEMTIHLGKYSLRRCARGTSMIDCIPDVKDTSWVEIDPRLKTISIYLK